MIELDIDKALIKEAKQKSEEMGELRNSITEGEGNVIGFLGEILVANHFGGVIDNTYDYDIRVGNRKVDVKTKKTTVVPLSHYLCTVAAYNTIQECDSYYFVRIDITKKKGYLLGGLTKKGFFKKAKFYKEGEIDPDGNGWTFKADCYNLPIWKLK